MLMSVRRKLYIVEFSCKRIATGLTLQLPNEIARFALPKITWHEMMKTITRYSSQSCIFN